MPTIGCGTAQHNVIHLYHKIDLTDIDKSFINAHKMTKVWFLTADLVFHRIQYWSVHILLPILNAIFVIFNDTSVILVLVIFVNDKDCISFNDYMVTNVSNSNPLTC